MIPRRRLVMTLKLAADDEFALVHALEAIALEFRFGGLRSTFATGAVDYGFEGETTEDPEMTHERYIDELDAYLRK